MNLKINSKLITSYQFSTSLKRKNKNYDFRETISNDLKVCCINFVKPCFYIYILLYIKVIY